MPAAQPSEPSDDQTVPPASPPRKRLWLALSLSVVYVVWMGYLLSIVLFG
jgi:hypothetical protein